MDLYAQDTLKPPTLHTQRLTLRPFEASDADTIVTALSDWDVTRWLTSVPYPYTRADAEWWLNNGLNEDPTLKWAIDDGAGIVGTVGVKPDLGYWLTSTRHGCGYMSEAVTAVLNHAFETGLTDIVSGHIVGNGPSRAVLLKHGFTDTHIADEKRRADGQTIKLQRMSLTRDTWLARRG